MSEQRIAPLAALGEEFHGLGEPRGSRPALTRRTLVIALLLLLLLGGVAAATLVVGRGAPLPAANPRDLESNGIPLPGTARLAGLDAPDPDAAEPPWDIRLSRTSAGETCTAVGQVVQGQFGIVGLDRVFRALPLGGVDACGVAAPHGPLLAGVRLFVGRTPRQVRTVVDGVAGPHARSVTVYGPGGARALRLGPDGSFITVYEGYVEELRPRLVVVDRSGRSETLAFAQSSSLEVGDPEGRSPWRVFDSADLEAGALPDENCAQASEDLGRSDPSRFEAPLTPTVCGRLGTQPLFVLMRRFVPGSGEHTGFPWGNSPARTLVYGGADPRVLALVLGGAGAPRRIVIDREGGGFLAVLDGHVDPRALTLTAVLRDGRTVSYTRSTQLYGERPNRPLAEPPVPPFREPVPAASAFPQPELPIAASIREAVHVKDPAGGPEWVLRSWLGRPDPRASYGTRNPGEMVCEQVGVSEHGSIVRPPPAAPVTLSPGPEEGEGDGGCNEGAWLDTHPPVGAAISFVGDPYEYAPVPLRTVVSCMLGKGATEPVLFGAGAPRRLTRDPHGAFLAVLPGRYWDANLRIEATVHGKHITGFPLDSFNGASALKVPQARAPDPNGGAPWGYGVSGNSSAEGQIIDGRLAAIDPEHGTLQAGPESWGGGGPQGLLGPKLPPVQLEAQSEPEPRLLRGAAGALSPPQVERRTLPGRTIITGRAQPDVVSVTLITPRDVRTLRPSGPAHALIAVYDGQFFSGGITAEVQLRDGRTVSEEVSNGPGGEPVPPKEQSLARQLATTRKELSGWRAPPKGNARLTEGYVLLRGSLRAIEGRIAFVHEHPGVLPEG